MNGDVSIPHAAANSVVQMDLISGAEKVALMFKFCFLCISLVSSL